MVALAFLNPFLLAGLGLAALPIVIHLLSKRQFRRVEWAAMRFLLDAEKQNRRRVRFEQWLLLGLRCLAMALLALLVARPFMRPNFVSSLLGGRGDVRRILVLDDSASLGYRGGAATDFANLRGSAERLLEWLRQEAPSDSVSLYVTSQPDKPVLEAAHLGETAGEEWRGSLGRLRPTDAAAHPSRVLGEIASSLSEIKTPIEIYLLSDFQRTDWLANAAFERASTIGEAQINGGRGELKPGGSLADGQISGNASAAFEPLRKLVDRLRVVLITGGNSNRENIGIVELRLDRPQTIAGVPTIATARVLNDTKRSLRDVHLEVEVDGSPQLGGQIESIEPGQSRDIGVEVVFAEEGHRELQVRLAGGDGLASDNTRRTAVAVKPNLSVLLVNGQPSSDPLRDEVQLPRNALAPPGPFASGMVVEVIDAADVESTELQRFDCVFLCNVPPPSEAAAAVLKRYVNGGGGLAIFLGEETGDGVEYNRILGADGAGLLPFAIDGGPQKSPKSGGSGLIRAGEHAVTAAFPSGQDNLSEYVHFNTYYRFAEIAASQPSPTGTTSELANHELTTNVLTRFSDGSQAAALMEKNIGRGRVLLFASTIDLDWNDWARAIDGSYVVTLLEIVQYSARRSPNQPAFIAGNPVLVAVSPEDYDPRVVIRTPAYPDEPVIETRLVEPRGPGDKSDNVAAGLAEARGPRALFAGTYRFLLSRRADGATEDRPVSVNSDAAETRLAAATPAELDAALGPIPHDSIQASEAFGAEQEPARRELWPTILALIVLTLMLEQALACWFGRPLGGTVQGRDRFVTAT